MQHYILIACASTKLSSPAPAADLYQSDLFRMSLRYARSLRPDGIFILSALHGILPPEREIAPYRYPLRLGGAQKPRQDQRNESRI